MRRLVRQETSDSRVSRPARHQERGQVLVLFVLIMVTCFLFCIVAITVGQVLVRRHQAQMVVDAAAFAGAAKQAEGMNTIARYNEKSLNFLRGIEYSKALAPFVDSEGTTEERFWGSIFAPIFGNFIESDWAGDRLEKLQKVFDFFSDIIDAVNIAYSPLSPFGPSKAASTVIDKNFEGNGSIFVHADLQDSGIIVEPARLAQIAHLVKLTDPETYEVNGYWYVFNPEMWAVDTCDLVWPADIPCGILIAAYAEWNTYIQIKRWADPIKYKTGRFYDNKEGEDVRFCYYLKITKAPVLFGHNFFSDIPPITVAAAAKPYGGYLGTKFEAPGASFYDTPSGKKISPTYKAKLVPLTMQEMIALGIRLGDFDDPLRYSPTGIFH